MLNRPAPIVTIAGGGASAHVLIPFLSGAGFQVQLLTRQPKRWSHEITLELQSVDQTLLQTFKGRLTKVSKNPGDLIPNSNIIVLCMPVHSYRSALHQIAPHLNQNKEVYLGALYGQAGFNWMTDEIRSRYGLQNVVSFAVGLLPWICRIGNYGHSGVIYGGCKAINIAAVHPRDQFETLNGGFFNALCQQWLNTGSFRQADNFLSLTLSVDNQIIHPARCFGLFQRYGGKWSKLDDIPYFYRDFDDRSAELLCALDADYSLVRGGIRQRFPNSKFSYMLDYLDLERLSYQSENSDIRESFTTSKTLGAIKPPVRQLDSGEWAIDINHRFFIDDIAYGICIAKWMAEQMRLSVPTMDAVIEWVQKLKGEAYIDNGKLLTENEHLNGRFCWGIPPVYGIRTLAEAVD